MNQVLQPYESHLQYLLQWMCDYNLYGCAYVNCSKVQFRGPVPESEEIDISTHIWHDASIPQQFMADPDEFPRQSHCTLEIDVCVQDILNRHELQTRPIHHNFLERLVPSKADEKYVPSMASLWRDETLRRKRRMGLIDPSSSPFLPEVLVSMSADARDTADGGWIHEKEYRELLQELIRTEGHGKSVVDMDTFIKPVDGEAEIRTALESVEDLYPTNLGTQTVLEEHQATDLEQTSDHSNSALLEALPFPDGAAIKDIGLDIVDHDGLEADDRVDVDQQPHDFLSILEAQIQRHEAELLEGLSENAIVAFGSSGQTESSGEKETAESGSSRKRPGPLEGEEPSKRQRLSASQKSSRQDSIRHLDGHRANRNSSRVQGDLPRSIQPSQSTIKAHGLGPPSALSFPVVKNPNAPETKLRLSQTSYSNSQDIPKTPTKHIDPKSLQNTSTPLNQYQTLPDDQGIDSTEHTTKAFSADRPEKPFFRAQATLYYAVPPPPSNTTEKAMMRAGIPPILYQDAYYSNEADVPDQPREYGGIKFRLQSTSIPYLPPFDPTGTSDATFGNYSVVIDKIKDKTERQLRLNKSRNLVWEFTSAPPSFNQVAAWLNEAPKKSQMEMERKPPQKHISQIEGPTQKNKHGFKFSQKKKSTSVQDEIQYMSILSLEVHVNSRGKLVPDPAEDEVQCIFWCIQDEEDKDNASENRPRVGLLCLSSEDGIVNRIRKQTSVEVESEEDELDLINRIVDIVRFLDPDILTGYEVHNSSWGYLIERARLKFEYDLCGEISRIKSQSYSHFGKDADRWGFTHTSTIRVTGRHMINIWRAMRGELNLLQYTMENVVFHLLHKRIPHYQHSDLTHWYMSTIPRDLGKVLNYFISRVQLNLDILETNGIVPRTSEQARLLGVDFFSVISRGSQFKVESTMFRIAKPENFILVSPSRKQVGQQNALECLPLVMEPRSAFYPDPVLVLDFQSLYPSVMIAYNYCYSTCLGRVVPWRGRNKMGFTDLNRDPQLLKLVKDHVNIAPNGIMYVRPELRKSLLAKMLGEILETRVMVKSGMKTDKDDKALQQLLNNRQLALKLLANVTYGYASASFSGRMPCAEIADSIVQTGRETLEKAIALIHSVGRWDAEVVYGDTDSLFIHLKGRTREQAFAIGEEIAEAVTKANPRPVKLKFEKVYHSCVLLAKKRYVGFKYESRNQKEPEFDAKGIETVRRDGTPAEQKIEEVALKILFRTSDLSKVKKYFQDQCMKIMEGRISIQDFLFAKEVKLGTYSDRGRPPPGAIIATKRMLTDPRTEPQYGERVPYVVINGAPGARLADRCVSPETLLHNDHVELDAEYYISKNLIPPLQRIFNLVGADVRQWYDQMPKLQRIRNVTIPINRPRQGGLFGTTNNARTLESYLRSTICLICRNELPAPSQVPEMDRKAQHMLPLCVRCFRKPARALLALNEMIRQSEESVKHINMICRNCSNLAWGEEIRCDSHDCPVFYTRVKERSKLVSLNDSVGTVIRELEDWIENED